MTSPIMTSRFLLSGFALHMCALPGAILHAFTPSLVGGTALNTTMLCWNAADSLLLPISQLVAAANLSIVKLLSTSESPAPDFMIEQGEEILYAMVPQAILDITAGETVEKRSQVPVSVHFPCHGTRRLLSGYLFWSRSCRSVLHLQDVLTYSLTSLRTLCKYRQSAALCHMKK